MKGSTLYDEPEAGKTTATRMLPNAPHAAEQPALPDALTQTFTRRVHQYASGHAEAVARQLATNLAAVYRVDSTVTARHGIAMLRLGDLCVWIRLGEISWSTGSLHPNGRPVTVAVPASQTAQAAEQIAARYRQVWGVGGTYAVRAG
ncbi:hypothetical protein ACQP1K_29280 (plasmid) [Sphaerimonospora sp. CA-214678]|uniref:hypothetical protein n=1 Tax=Sphaerimonospora sp. CA-214678 TaxID=3240029 RepID=UPI003D8E94D3